MCISQDVPYHDKYFIEDFLETLYNKLAESIVLERDGSYESYGDYEEQRHLLRDAPEGYRAKTRLKSLRMALKVRLGAWKEAVSYTHL